MAIKNQNFEMYQNENKRLIISIVDDSENNKDLTGGSATFCIINTEILKTTDNGITIDTYKLNVLLDRSDTESICGSFDYQVRATDSSGNSEITTTGRIQINKAFV